MLGAGLLVVAGVARGRAGRPDARPRAERHEVLPQRIVRQVCPVPDRLAKAGPDRGAARGEAVRPRGAGRAGRPGPRAPGDHGADLDLRPGHLRIQADGIPVRARLARINRSPSVSSLSRLLLERLITTADPSSSHALGSLTDRESIDEHRTGNRPSTSRIDEDRDQWEWSDEGLFARDLDGRLIRYDAATREELDKEVTLEIDGQKVVVKKAVVATDEQGKPRYDERRSGHSPPHHDLRRRQPALREAREATVRITGPPSGAVRPERTCSSERPAKRTTRSPSFATRRTWTRWLSAESASCNGPVSTADGEDRGRRQAPARVPAPCRGRDDRQHDRVARYRRQAADRNRGEDPARAADGRPSDALRQGAATSNDCELEALAAAVRRGPAASPTARAPSCPRMTRRWSSPSTTTPASSATAACGAATSIKQNHVIGRMGKGYTARIAFDLDVPMGSSSCVACGECMVSCPTGA